MTSDSRFRLATLAVALAACYPLATQAATPTTAGTVMFAVGEVTVLRNGASIPLAKGATVDSGDVLVTGPNGRAQVRQSDGGFFALQPNTRFTVSNYLDKQDPKEDRFFVSLTQGGLRAITGLIGKRNHDNYKVQTPTALIGIRGSAFTAFYDPSDKTLRVAGEQDAIEVCTAGGCVGLTVGETALVRPDRPSEQPSRTSSRSSLPIPQPVQEPQVVSNQVDGSGNIAAVVAALPPGDAPAPPPPPPAPPPPGAPKVVGTVANAVFSERNATGTGSGNGVITGTIGYDAGNQVVAFDPNGSHEIRATTQNNSIAYTSGTPGSADWMAMGSWGSYSAAQGTSPGVVPLTYVTGAPSASLSGLAGQRATYALTSSTPVYSSVAGSAPGTLLGGSTPLTNTTFSAFPSIAPAYQSQVTVDFLSGRRDADVQLYVDMPANTNGAEVLYTLRGSVSGTGTGFGGTLANVTPSCLDGSIGACASGSVLGFFNGDAAQRLGLTFNAGSAIHGDFGGAAVFSRGDPSASPAPAITGVASFYQDSGSGSLSETSIDTSRTHQFIGNELLAAGASYSYSQGVRKVANAASDFGGVGVPGGTFAGWGYWSQGENVYSGTSSGTVDNVHYVVGTPTSSVSVPVTGSAHFGLVSGSTPTLTIAATENGSASTQFGQLKGATLDVNFSTASAEARAMVSFDSTGPMTIGSAVSLNNGRLHNVYSVAPTDSISGALFGDDYGLAGFVYGRELDSNTHVTGAVVLARNGNAQTAADITPIPSPPPPPPPPTISGMSVAGISTDAFNGHGVTGHYLEGATTTLNDSNEIVQFEVHSGNYDDLGVRTGSLMPASTIGGVPTSLTTGTVAGGDFMTIGTWDGASWTNAGTPYGSNDSHFSFVAGIPETSLSVGQGMRASYTLLAATPVYTAQTFNDVPLSGTVDSATLNVDFLGGNKALGDLTLGLTLPRYGDNSSGSYVMRGSLTADGYGAGISGNMSISSAGCLAGSESCSVGQARGFFGGGGTTGAQVGLKFSGYTDLVSDFGGALLFGQNGIAPYNAAYATPGFNYSQSFAYFDESGLTQQRTMYSPASSVKFLGGEVVSHDQSVTDFMTKTGSKVDAGYIGTPGTADFIGWGAWDAGTTYGSNTTPTVNVSNVHYVIGQPTATMPVTGSASYTLLGGTAPVSSSAGAGVLVNGDLQANFATAQVAVNLGLQFNVNDATRDYRVVGNGQFRNGNGFAEGVILPAPASPVTGTTSAPPIQASIGGLFTGANGYRAGITYQFGSHPDLGNVNGAAVFQKTGTGTVGPINGG